MVTFAANFVAAAWTVSSRLVTTPMTFADCNETSQTPGLLGDLGGVGRVVPETGFKNPLSSPWVDPPYREEPADIPELAE
jgi:hypothetical protein